ncbi:MAG: hypothetical protein AAF719_00760 [Pseudomonadota bacterium]
MPKTLREALAAFDGKAVSLLSEAAVRFGDDPGYIDQLIHLSADPSAHMSSGSTWLLKAHLDEGGTLDMAHVDALADQLAHIVDWQAQLHICQCIARLQPTQTSSAKFAGWLQPLLTHKRPFLRAWSLDAFCAVARVDLSYMSDAKAALAAAQEDSAASVRARARKIKI